MFASRKISTRKFPKRLPSESVIALCLIAWSGPAWAYRPFDGTDAAVAEPGEMEIELQPAGAQRASSQTTLIAPATVINYGFAKNWEAILQGQIETPLTAGGPSSLTQAGAFLKHVIVPGSFQDKPGPSVATEFGVHARPADSAEAVRAADVICTCTRATEPLFDGSWVKPGVLVAAIGASKPQARELDDTLLRRADLIVVEWQTAALAEAGEFVRAAPGILDPTRVVELGKLLVHGTPYTRRPSDIVIYKSVGVGLEDVALANLVWQRAQ